MSTITEKISLLKEFYDNLNWEHYIEITDSIVRIDQHKLSEELENHARIYSYYSSLLQRAKLDFEKIELKFNQYCAMIRKSEDENYRLEHKSKPTDKYLETHTLLSSDYTKYYEDMLMAEYKYNLLKSLASSLEARKDLLVQLSSNSRAEAKIYS